MSVGEVVGVPLWARSSLRDRVGRDPLGLQTTTQDRLMPLLLPGVLELSRQPRYLSFHVWLLSWYQRERLKLSRSAQELFIRRSEWDLGLAVLACARCSSSPVGATRLRGVDRGGNQLPRGLSVKTEYGGYGLYYRSPLEQLGCVSRAGVTLPDGTLREVDVLTSSPRAEALAEAFAAVIEPTQWVADGWLTRTDPIPREVIEELSALACLCRLPGSDAERDAVHAVLFDVDATDSEPVSVEAQQRRRGFAHYLSQLDGHGEMVSDESSYRRGMSTVPEDAHEVQQHTAGLWAGLVAKDVWQEALCSLWDTWLEVALTFAQARQRDTLQPSEVQQLLAELATDGTDPTLNLQQATSDLDRDLAAGLTVATPQGPLVLSGCDLEALRVYTEQVGTAASALLTVLALRQLAAGRDDPGWRTTAMVGSAWQPSLAQAMARLDMHLDGRPTVADTVGWLVREFVLGRHEAIGNSKLPEFTFRWRWEEGRLRLYDHGRGRFPRAAIRQVPFATVSRGLALWEQGKDGPQVSARGKLFVDEVFA